MPTVLVTGLNGFTGRYLADELRLNGYSVSGIGIDADVPPGVSITKCDLMDRNSVLATVKQAAPDYVIHLAGIAFAAHGDVESIYRTNVVGTRNLLEAIAGCRNAPKMVVLASSAHVYGNATNSPIAESTIAAPTSDYAVSKLAMEYMANLWANRLPIAVVRPFNYTGVGQSSSFLVPKIVDHFRRSAKTIELGNLHVIRDFSDVRDVVRKYRLLLESASAGQVFNMCSGVGHSLEEILQMMRELSHHELDVLVKPAFVRDNEVHCLIGSCAKLDTMIAPSKAIPLRETLAWMLQQD